jgi:hypothetical protein
MRRSVLAAALVAVGAFAFSGTALATPPTPAAIEVETVFADGFGTFTSSTPGLCPSGTTTDMGFATAFQTNTMILFHVRKTFDCADGSGTFTAQLQVRFVFANPFDTFVWAIVDGTGAYSNLRGTGTGVGDQLAGEVDDHFVGTVHFD